jgi:imidazoleglycerol phosphate synthase cyclase subunit
VLTHRIIPCLDVRDGLVVKGVRFQELREMGSPAEFAWAYEQQGADELVLLDVSATPEGRKTKLDTVRRVRERISIPLTVGGGVGDWTDARALLEAGADKVAVNTAAVAKPELIAEISSRFGVQCTVLAVDAKQTAPGQWQVVVRSGATDTGIDVLDWVRDACRNGAGEILLTSWDRDGTRSGYDLALVSAVARAVGVPVIASGGADTPQQLLDALQAGADAVLAASIFHEGNYTVAELKKFLAAHLVEVRR